MSVVMKEGSVRWFQAMPPGVRPKTFSHFLAGASVTLNSRFKEHWRAGQRVSVGYDERRGELILKSSDEEDTFSFPLSNHRAGLRFSSTQVAGFFRMTFPPTGQAVGWYWDDEKSCFILPIRAR